VTSRERVRTGQLLDRLRRLPARRVLHVGGGDQASDLVRDLAAALAGRCSRYDVVDAASCADGYPPGRYDLILLDLAPPRRAAAGTVDPVHAAASALGRVKPDGAVFVADMRDPRLERLVSWARTGRPECRHDPACWSPAAILRALDVAAPAARVHVYPPLGPLTGPAASAGFDVVVRPPQQAGDGRAAARPPLPLRWGREVLDSGQLSRLLSRRGPDRVRIVGIPLRGVVETAADRLAEEPWVPGRRRLGAGVDRTELEAAGAEHGYLLTYTASLTGAVYHFDIVLERQPTASGQEQA